jgi:hypothetical protein
VRSRGGAAPGRAVDRVEIAQPRAHPGRQRQIAVLPRQHAVVVPLERRRQLAAHEQELLAGERPLVAVQQPQVGVLLPRIARHLAEQRPLPCTTSSWDSGRTKLSLSA